MTKRLAFLLALALPAAYAAAQSLRAPVVVPVIGFKVKLEDGRVIATWRRYKRDDFKYYKLTKSLDADPPYPGKAALYSGVYPGDTRFEDGQLSTGTWHYRVFILTQFGDLWASPPADVTIRPEDVKRAAPTDADFE